MSTSTSPVDWESAAWWARTLTPVGPTVTRGQAQRVTASLRHAAQQAPQVVGDVTGLHEASHIAEGFPRLVVDRARWAEANVGMFAELTAGHLPGSGAIVPAQGAAAELGAMLGLLATRVLGQFDPFSSRLYLVAPNIVNTRRAMGVDEADFAMWVALHEQTHAVQFAAAPWLADYLRRSMTHLLQSMTQDQWSRAWMAMRRLPSALRRSRTSSTGILTDLSLNDDERAHLERVVAVMSMLEGHADVVMDSAEEILPATAAIRSRFNRRRHDTRGIQGLVRRLVGMDAKLRQYTDGAAFITEVVEHAGHAGVNLAFAHEGNLPTPHEISHPRDWVTRVVG